MPALRGEALFGVALRAMGTTAAIVIPFFLISFVRPSLDTTHGVATITSCLALSLLAATASICLSMIHASLASSPARSPHPAAAPYPCSSILAPAYKYASAPAYSAAHAQSAAAGRPGARSLLHQHHAHPRHQYTHLRHNRSAGMRMSSTPLTAQDFVPGVTCTGERVCVVGASGYIGRSVVRECVRRGYPTTAVVRNPSNVSNRPELDGADLAQADVTSTESLAAGPLGAGKVDVVISCLASRTGTKSDSYAIDLEATRNCMEAAAAAGARHFVLLSAFCVAKPWLQFQFAKLEMEAALADQDKLTYSVVRPTAFFKSVSGQLEVVQSGAPFVVFDLGDGRTTKCNPISEKDLAMAIVDTIADPARSSNGGDPIWNLGGPGPGISMEEQGKLLADAVGKKPWVMSFPSGIFDVVIGGLQWLADKTGSPSLEDAAELGRIGKYYAVEDMLTTQESEKYGNDTLKEHYERIAVEGNEYDPYTTMFASKPRD